MKRYLLAALLLAAPASAALTNVNMIAPEWFPMASATGDGTTGVTLNATGEKCAQRWVARAAGNITGVDVRFATVTEEDGITVSLQNLDSSGQPDGTQDQTCTIALADTDDDTWKACTFGSARTVAVGDIFAVVVEFTSYVDGDLQCESDDTLGHIFGNAYALLFTSSWAKNNDTLQIGLHYSGTYHEQVNVPIGIRAAVTYNSGSTEEETGAKWTAQMDAQVCGVRALVDEDNALDVVMYDSGSSVLESITVNIGERTATSLQMYEYLFDTPQTVSSGSVYRFSLKPTSGSNISSHYRACPSAAARSQFPWGEHLVWTARNSPAAWSDDTTRYPLIQPILCQVHPTSGGGSVTAPMFGQMPPMPPPGMRMREATVWDGKRFRPGYVLEAGSVGDWWEPETVPAVLHGTARPREEWH